MNIVHLGILAERKLTFINEFSELCTRANAGHSYVQGFHPFMYKNTHQAVLNRREGTCPEMCGVITIRTGRAAQQQGTLRETVRTTGTVPGASRPQPIRELSTALGWEPMWPG